MPFRLKSSQLFLTYPQCDLDKQIAYDYLCNRFEAEKILVAHELHANGDHHLHVYLKSKGTINTNDSKFADLPGGYHGNYQGCRSAKNVLKYCTKDEDYLANFDVTSLLSTRSTRSTDFQDLLNRKRTLEELLIDKPQYLINYNTLSKNLQIYFENTERQRETIPWCIPNPWGKLLLNFQELHKRRHFWIFSSGPNSGKTTFALELTQKYGGCINSNREPYWNIGPQCRFVIIDEYNSARFRYDELNAMADGTYSYRRFQLGLHTFNRGQFPILIVLSNQTIDDIYPFRSDLLKARFIQIDISKFRYV